MIKLIGKENCSACKVTKTILKNKKIDFEYKLLNDLSLEEQDFYIKLAQDSNMISLPLIVVDKKLKTLQEIINN